ncbi:hypothetical protein THERMOT_496 [Bathymodiolus thermophilus thioautotrophic gill symbiont]|nr:hypothetical protein THERMOT_496 [Bathymodiolus thermophilus thioautotrophic gill symbiont]
MNFKGIGRLKKVETPLFSFFIEQKLNFVNHPYLCKGLK